MGISFTTVFVIMGNKKKAQRMFSFIVSMAQAFIVKFTVG